jgi:hypothetical protein
MKSSPPSPAVVQLAKLVCSRHGDDPRSYPTEEDRWLAILEELNLVLEVFAGQDFGHQHGVDNRNAARKLKPLSITLTRYDFTKSIEHGAFAIRASAL